ncbi:HAD-IIA family hydrolase [Marinitenerispora sediminis]|uniref:HAD family hydrolase n=1 Tax=Marinitenerispora sediminis TaxID=1931232 RepID=A0A368T707_9ACTN|nr:HAD-IIA family hydrolase [Marinitenerispora sediminis]RCV54237.1 HAD family hydrolase [Marinitenerispora sediminis]RCV59523.1 HAD family hydrolase [Marinitenerispora sediminis]RCV59783.1 HAD family hydrolase [Marinitenerispora sediminis]
MTLKAADQPLHTRYDAALLDLDGVVYIGGRVVPAAPEAIEKAQAGGMRVAFVTNNAARTPAAIAERLTRMGVPATVRQVVTSAQAAARLVAERFPAGSAVLAVGDTGLRQALRQHGLRPVTVAAEQPVAVVQGYSPRLGHDLLVEGALAVMAGALFVLTNGDSTAPLDRGVQPGNGSFGRVIAQAAGTEPLVAGKPERPLHEEGVRRTGARNPLVVGDRLDTDIEGATNRGVDSLLVLSGVTTPAQLLLAGPRHRPSYLAHDIGGVNLGHPPTGVAAGRARCGGWTAACRAGRLELSGHGDRLDGLRALCAAAWSAPGGADQAAVREPLAQLGW